MATHNVLARWVTPGGHPQRRLVFFPHAGAGGLTGRSLAADDVEVLAHRRPGREARMAEPVLTSVAEVLDEAVEVLLPVLDADDLPTDILGHSFGACWPPSSWPVWNMDARDAFAVWWSPPRFRHRIRARSWPQHFTTNSR
nr:thioesterase domain-containing protein [Kocuria atrinae]